MRYPLDNPVTTQLFGENPSDYAEFGFPGHNGLDLVTYAKPPFVYSISPGIVDKVSWEAGGYGKYIVILHPGNWLSYYAHLDTVLVLPSQVMDVNTPIGVMGTTGNSSGPHLHLGIRMNYTTGPYKGYIDPLPILNETLKIEYFLTNYPKPASKPAKPQTPVSKLVGTWKNKTIYRMKRLF